MADDWVERRACPDRGTASYMITPTIISLFLSGTSIFGIKHTPYKDFPFVLGGFTLLLTHGLFGVVLYGHPKPAVVYRLNKLHRVSTFFAIAAPLALLNTETHLKYHFNDHISYGYLVSSLLPMLMNIYRPRLHEDILDIVIFGNITSLGYQSIMFDNYWMLSIAFLCAINHFVLNRVAEIYDIPKPYLTSVGLSIFNLFTVYCLKSIIL